MQRGTSLKRASILPVRERRCVESLSMASDQLGHLETFGPLLGSSKGTLPLTIVALRRRQSDGRVDRELTSDLKMLAPVGERPTTPGLESGLIVGNIATQREPGL